MTWLFRPSPRWQSVPQAAFGRLAHVVGRGDLHRQVEGALLAGMHRAHADHVPGEFVALVVAHAQHHRIFPGTAFGRMPDHAFDLKRGVAGARLPDPPRARSVEAQIMLARRADARAFEARVFAVRTATRRTCRTRL